MCVVRTRHYEAGVSVPSAARNVAHAVVLAALSPEGWGLADDADLVASELVSAALAAHPSWLELTVDLHFDRLDITVVHDGERPPAEDSISAMRRGLLAAVTADYRQQRRPGGTTALSASLSCDARTTLEVPCSQRPA